MIKFRDFIVKNGKIWRYPTNADVLGGFPLIASITSAVPWRRHEEELGSQLDEKRILPLF